MSETEKQDNNDVAEGAEDNVTSMDAAASLDDAAASLDDAAKIAALEVELAEAKERTLRALAEVENTRKRSERAQQDANKFAVTGFAKDMLDVADNMRRAIDAVPADQVDGNEQVKMLIEGIQATQSVILRAFEKHGIEVIAPEQGRFDPNMHEVMFEAEMPGVPAGSIIQLLEPGYALNGRLLRPARVGVSKGDPSGHAVDTQV